jgi:hypothetical protein
VEGSRDLGCERIWKGMIGRTPGRKGKKDRKDRKEKKEG